jgi:guanine nucleotide-binding protein subunit alpha
VLKQMKLIYAQGFSKNEKLEWKPVVFNNVVQSMRLIFDVMSDQGIDFENKDNEVKNYPMPSLPTPIEPHAGADQLLPTEEPSVDSSRP